MIRKKYHTAPFFWISAVSFFLLAEILPAQPQRAYERGLEELSRENVTRALDIWYMSYEQPGGIDSRIGLEFIRVVTDLEMKEYYEQATELYYRALSGGTGTHSRVAIRQEIERMAPIIGEGIYRQWTQWWDDQDPELGRDMRGYWVQIDPTPSKPSNERLIEHWERIAEAQKRFTKNTSTVYDTDDRALTYIRYGEPDRIKSGIFTIQSTQIRQWLQNQYLPPREEGERPSRELSSDRVGPQLWETGHLENAIYEFHTYPEYEIWFYDDIRVNDETYLPFIFGTDIQTGEFSAQGSIDDFIPDRAFQNRRTEDDGEETFEFTRAGVTPALMLQLLYYEQLAAVDPFFENRLADLQNLFLDQGMDAFRGMDLAFRTQSREIMQQQLAQTPREKSTYNDLIPGIPFHIYHYRFLDDSLRPQILTYVESFPQEAFLIDFHQNRGRIQAEDDVTAGKSVPDVYPYYEFLHSLQEYDESWNIEKNLENRPGFVLPAGSVQNQPSVSYFEQPHTGQAFQSVAVELLNYDPETETIYDTPFPDALRGINKTQYRLSAPLESSADSLEMADLVLGFQQDGHATDPFSFRVANDRMIPHRETLVLHFEVYNLQMQDNGFTQFELTYRILPVDEAGNILSDQTEFILTLNFTSEEQQVIEDLEIETADLYPGLYNLSVEVKDLQTGQMKERDIRFEVES